MAFPKSVLLSLAVITITIVVLFTHQEYIVPTSFSKPWNLDPMPIVQHDPLSTVQDEPLLPTVEQDPVPQHDSSSILDRLTKTISSPEWLAKLTSHIHQTAVEKSAKPRYIFVDLGANAADSLEVFYQHEGSKYQYDYSRPDWATHSQAEIFLFEANPLFNTKVIEAKQKYTAKGRSITMFPSTVVDVKDGTRTFFLDTVNQEHDYWGSSIYSTQPDVKASKSNGTELSAINIARWLLMNTLPRDFVVVKMDIEGAEYEVVPHMLEMGCGKVVDHLLVEWHGNIKGVTDDEETLARANAAKEALKKEGVQMPDYDSGA